MHRVLEPEVMDTRQDAVEYDAMDFSEPNTAFAEAAVSLLGGHEGAEILDVGTGTADIPVRVLQRHATARIVAVDLAGEMLRIARDKVAAAGLSGRCRVEIADAKALPYDDGRFDMVMCNSTVHHIPEPLVLFREMGRVVKKGGALIVRDLFRPATAQGAWDVVHRAAPGASERQQKLFFDSLRAALTLDEVRDLATRAGIGAARIARCSDRHWALERAL